MTIIGSGLLSVCLFLLAMSASCNRADGKKRVIASVGDAELTLDEVMEDISPPLREKLSPLDIREYVLRWIDNEVLYQEATLQQIHEKPEVQKALERLKKELVINNLMQTVFNREAVVAEAEIKEYYDNNPDEFKLSEDIVYVHHILVETR